MEHNFKLGADPEFFLSKDGLPISAHEYLGVFGGKHNPKDIGIGALQVDGTALEFNIRPAETATQFVHNIDKVLGRLREAVKPEHKFEFIPVNEYPADYYKSIPLHSLELGCDPDYNAWTEEENPRPNSEALFRTASGHIHIGFTQWDKFSLDAFYDSIPLVKQLDAVLYPVSLLWDKDVKRRELYGKPGAFRVKPYGTEYRVLSNSWLNYKKVQHWIFEATKFAFEELKSGNRLFEKLNPLDVTFETAREYHDILVEKFDCPSLAPQAV